MICSIHQPEYLPWLGFFSKILRSDIFIIYDDAQFSRGDYHNRNRIRNNKINWQWLTVPILFKFGDKIKDVKIDNNKNWRKNHWKSILFNYTNTKPYEENYNKKYFEKFRGVFEEIYKEEWNKLIDLDMEIIHRILNILKIDKKIYFSSQLNVDGKRTEKLIGLCKAVNADTYLSGEGSKEYLDKAMFEKEGIGLKFNDIKTDWNDLSIIDSLFRIGNERTRRLL